MAERCVTMVQNMYEGRVMVPRCGAGVTAGFKVEMGLHQGLTLIPFLFAEVMDRLTDGIRRESLRTDVHGGRRDM